MAATFVFKRQPREHQMKAFNLSRDKPSFAYLMDMGTGKSKVVLDVAADLFLRKEIYLLLIVAPNQVHRKWIEHDVPADLACEYHAMWWGKSQEAQRAWEPAGQWPLDRLLVRAVTVDSFAVAGRPAGIAAKHILERSRKAMVVIDESSTIKTPGAKRTKALINLSKRPAARYRRILTGTAVSKGLEDLYSQFKFLHPMIIGTQTYAEFKSRYCIMGVNTHEDGNADKKIVGYDNTDELLNKIEPYVFRVNKKDCLDLPPKIREELRVDLSPEQKRIYTTLADELILLTKDGPIDVELAIVRLMRLQQVVGGHVTNPDGKITELACPRLDYAVELARQALESGQKVVIWCRFTAEISRLARQLTASHVTTHTKIVRYSGLQSDEMKAEGLRRFQTGEADIMLATQASGGMGVEMTAASVMIYYSNSFSFLHRMQSEDRAYRLGQTKKLTIYDLISSRVCRKIMTALKKRKNLSDLVNMVPMRELVIGDDQQDIPEEWDTWLSEAA